MKKLLIVNNNMNVGGVQKSLYNLLWSIRGQYEITLCLFRARGDYLLQLPPEVKVLEDRSLFSCLGLSQGECRGLKQRLTRGALAALTRLFGRFAVMRLLLWSKKTLPEEYDCVIAFLHNGNPKNFYGGVQDFVLRRTRAKKKIAFLHCDYATCGANHPRNNRLLGEFDAIAACSEGCKEALLSVLPGLEGRCTVVHNCHRYGQLRSLADSAPQSYEPGCLHLLMVCRLAHEKGVDRALRAMAAAKKQGLSARLHLVGDGAKAAELKELCRRLQLENAVTFHGQQPNPYGHMAAADLLLITSHHEAAPMVIEEAASLGLPTLTVCTTSAREMVQQQGRGWVCAQSDEALEQALLALLANPQRIKAKKQELLAAPAENAAAEEEFRHLMES